MKQSSNEIYTNGVYFKNNPEWDIADAKWKAEVIHSLLKKNNIHPADLVEAGCGAGGILVELSRLDEGIGQLKGYDISPQAIELAKKNASKKIQYFNADLTASGDISTDVLLVIDVLEHVDDFYGFLRKLKPMSGHFVFHIPLDLSCRTIMKPHVLLQQRNSVGHIHYFTKETALWALKDTGYEVIDWVYTKPVVDVETPSALKRYIKKMLRNFSFAINRDWSAKKWGGYSMMILVK